MKRIIILLILSFFFSININNAFADAKDAFEICDLTKDTCIDKDYYCQPSKSDPKTSLCQPPLGAFEICTSKNRCINNYDCLPSKSDPKTSLCQETPPVAKVFGKIKPPDVLAPLLAKDPTGAGAISNFLSRLVSLIYIFAAIFLIFFITWGAWDWMTSEGDKEKLQSARNKIINALVGIVLFAAAYALIQILGQFTGFTFFSTPSPKPGGP